MANANLTLRKSDYSAYGIECRDDVRHEIFKGTAAALVAAGLIGAHQIPGQPGTGKAMAGYLPDGARVRQGSNSAQHVPGYRRIFKAGKNFVLERRFDDAEVSRREACYAAVWKKDIAARVEAAAWREMRTTIEQCCFGGLRLVWQIEV